MSNDKFSQEAKWFLEKVQQTQQEAAEEIGSKLAILDKNGQFITQVSWPGEGISKLVFLDQEDFGLDLSKMFSEKEEPVFEEQKDVIATFWVPITDDEDNIVAALVGAGSIYNYIDSGEELRGHFLDIYQQKDLDVDQEEFLQRVDQTPKVDKVNLIKRAREISELVSVLVNKTQLREYFK